MYRSLFAAMALVGLWGCSGFDNAPKLPSTVPVSGTVKLNGELIEGAVVTFIPTGDTTGIECIGRTDESGTYSPKQVRGGDGVPPGTYKVVINRFMRNGKPVIEDDAGAGAGGAGIMIDSIPPKYSNPSSTTLTAKVSEEGNMIDFELESK